jgi:hypothetical protein
MVSKGNYPQMVLFQVGKLLWTQTKKYHSFCCGFCGGGYVSGKCHCKGRVTERFMLPMESNALWELKPWLVSAQCTLPVQVGFHRGWMGLHHRHWTRKWVDGRMGWEFDVLGPGIFMFTNTSRWVMKLGARFPVERRRTWGNQYPPVQA